MALDASLEEILHLIRDVGYVHAHPDLSPGGTRENRLQGPTKLTDAMDIAPGRKFTSDPTQYPDGAWYT